MHTSATHHDPEEADQYNSVVSPVREPTCLQKTAFVHERSFNSLCDADHTSDGGSQFVIVGQTASSERAADSLG